MFHFKEIGQILVVDFAQIRTRPHYDHLVSLCVAFCGQTGNQTYVTKRNNHSELSNVFSKANENFSSSR